jgi:Tol biopolymer transport system component
MLATDAYPAGAWSFFWSPDSEHIAFWRREFYDVWNPLASVHVVDLEGNEQTVVDAWHFTWWVEMSWSPDGAHLALTRGSTDGYADLLIAAVDGPTLMTIVDSRETGMNARFPHWSPAGNGIVFEGNDGLWSIHADGSGLTHLTTDAGDAQARYCPDGSKIAFIRSNTLWLVNADGSDAHLLDAESGP